MDSAMSGGQDIKAEFARRKKGRNYAILGMLVVLGVMLWVENTSAIDTHTAIAILGVDILAMLGFFVYQYRMWRCPACHGFLGMQTSSYRFGRELTACPKCKAEFI
jgi:hypothetical protein